MQGFGLDCRAVFADQGAGLAQVDGPVQPQHVTVERAHFLEPQAAALGEDDAWNAHAAMLFFDLGQHPRGVGQAELLERAVRQHAAPAVKNHHGLGAGLDLAIQVRGHGVGIDVQHFVHQVGPLVQHGLDQAVVVGTRAFDHITGQCPGAAAETDQGHAAVQGLAD